jgi:PAS domain S-box-containing protein
MGLGAIVLFGWAFDVRLLQSVHPSFATMKPNTALLFLVLGGSLRMSVGADLRSGVRRALAALVIALAAASAAQNLLGVDFGIDELLFRVPVSGASELAPGRMSPATALNFVLLGLGLLARRPDVPDARFARAAVLAAALSSFVALAGYVFSVRSLYTVEPYSSIAVHTVLGFLLACTAFITARPNEGWMAIATHQSAAGVLLRRVLPLAAGGILALGWLKLWGDQLQFYDTPFRIALLTVADVVLLVVVMSGAAVQLHRSHLELGASEERFRLMVEAIHGYAIFMLDAEGRVATWNAGAERSLGYEARDVLGRHVSIFYSSEDVEAGKPSRELELARREGRFEVEDWRLHKDGTRFWATVVMAAISDADRRIVGFAQVVRDVTARHRAAEQFRLVLEALPTGMLVTDEAGRIVLVNAQIEQLFGYRREELIGSDVERLVPERLRERHAAQRQAFLREPRSGGKRVGRTLWGLRKDGSEVPIEIGLTALKLAERDVVLSSVVDMTERKRAEREREELFLQKKAAEQLRERSRFFELSIDMVCIANTGGRFLQMNPAFSQNLGYSTQELLDRPVLEFVHPEDRAATQRELDRLASGQPTLDFLNRYQCKNGDLRWFQWRAISEADGSIYAVARDVTRDRELLEALQRQQASLSANLKEREVLLQEVHHRVKNNLQVISSLINLQMVRLQDGDARRALEECRTRIETIALIHEKLYQAHDYARIPFSEYVTSLARNILRASGAAGRSISLEVESDDVLLSVDRAIPCALMLNEIITNSLKHAFPNGRQGRIRVRLRKSDDRVQLAVEDDGVGMPAGFDPCKSRSLGMQLVTTLNEQLEGRMEILRGAGTKFQIEFALEGQA